MARAFDLVEMSRETEAEAVAQIYASWQPVDFSRDILMPHPGHTAVVRLPDVGWTDLGQPERVRSFLVQHGLAESRVPAELVTDAAS